MEARTETATGTAATARISGEQPAPRPRGGGRIPAALGCDSLVLEPLRGSKDAGDDRDPRPGVAPRLGERARAEMSSRRCIPRTDEAHSQRMRLSYEFRGRQNPADLGAEHAAAFPNAFATSGGMAIYTQNQAARRAVLASGIPKRATCHTFRHSFATHLTEDESDIGTVQVPLGYQDVAAKMISSRVLHRGAAGVRGPADRLLGGGDRMTSAGDATRGGREANADVLKRTGAENPGLPNSGSRRTVVSRRSGAEQRFGTPAARRIGSFGGPGGRVRSG